VHKAVVEELIQPGHGWTRLSQRVLTELDQTHTIRLYELLSHWKDKEVFPIPLQKFRQQFGLEGKYTETRELLRSVITPARKKLEEMSDLLFVCEPARTGRTITHLRFVIRNRDSAARANGDGLPDA
jgi:plasmid replication initiation protein